MANVMKINNKDAVSVHTISATKKDREMLNKAFKEQKAVEKKHKDERFAKIRNSRKNRLGSKGINIEIKGN